MIRLSPTPDAYALAARIWTALGKPRQAEALRAEARKAFAAETLALERAAAASSASLEP